MSQTTSPVRIFLAFVLVLLLAMLLAAVLSPWVQALLAPLAIFPLHRVFSRLTMLGVIGLTAWLMIRQQLAQRALLGFNRPWPLFLRRLLVGMLGGIALMALALLPLFLLGVRAWSARLPADVAGLSAAGAEGHRQRPAGGVDRRDVLSWRDAGCAAAPGGHAHCVVRSAGALQRRAFPGARGECSLSKKWTDSAGLWRWRGFFVSFAHPLRIADAFVALYFVGLLLALVRQRWGDIAGSIGLHAGFVAVIAVFRKISAPAPEGSWSFLVGSFDGLLGIWIAALTAAVCIVVAKDGAWRSHSTT